MACGCGGNPLVVTPAGPIPAVPTPTPCCDDCAGKSVYRFGGRWPALLLLLIAVAIGMLIARD